MWSALKKILMIHLYDLLLLGYDDGWTNEWQIPKIIAWPFNATAWGQYTQASHLPGSDHVTYIPGTIEKLKMLL